MRSNRRISALTIWIIAIIAVTNFFQVRYWNQENRIIAWDVISYYAYLPASFIYDDITLSFTGSDPDKFSDKFWPHTTKEGDRVIKTTMGVSYFYIPGFIAGHIVAISSGVNADGFTAPYRFFLQLGGIFVMIISLRMLRKLLLRYYNDTVTAVTIILITFATNLYYYGTLESTYSHIYSFFLVILFIQQTIKFYRNPSPLSPALLGFTLGLITLIRPSNIIIVIIFAFWGINTLAGLQERIKSLVTNYRLLIIMAIFFILPWIPQLLYWKEVTGNWLFYSYLGEKFFFGQPHFIEGFFSFRKGLLIYTPLFLIMWIGIFFLKRELRPTRLIIIIFTVVNSYIILSWWCWWYGGSYGQRPFIDTLGLYALPLAALIDAVTRMKKLTRYLISGLLTLLLLQGVFQTFQYYYGAIHWDSMTRTAWVDSFGRLKPSDRFNSLLIAPDYEKAKATGKD